MPIEVGIWKFGDGLKRVKMQSLDSESRLEDCLCADLSILSPGLMLIGRWFAIGFRRAVSRAGAGMFGFSRSVILRRCRETGKPFRS